MEIQNLNQALNHLNVNTINVMQILVLQEVDRQLKQLASNQALYIKPLEVATFALNRLPSLYASSQEGLRYQLKQAKREYKPQIIVAVRQGVAAVQRDPLRLSTPLTLKKQLSKTVKPNTTKVRENPDKFPRKSPQLHSINSHMEYCQMAMELATA